MGQPYGSHLLQCLAYLQVMDDFLNSIERDGLIQLNTRATPRMKYTCIHVHVHCTFTCMLYLFFLQQLNQYVQGTLMDSQVVTETAHLMIQLYITLPQYAIHVVQ